MEMRHFIKSSDDGGGWRFGWHPKTLVFSITAALILSIISAFDCKFLVSSHLAWRRGHIDFFFLRFASSRQLTSPVAGHMLLSYIHRFQEVDFGFTPQNYYADSVGFSLWSYAAPDGRCLTYAEARQSVIFSSDGGGRNVYSNFFISNDTSWTISRMLAVVGPVFGNFALVCVENKSVASSY
jgi:hypothetical protein